MQEPRATEEKLFCCCQNVFAPACAPTSGPAGLSMSPPLELRLDCKRMSFCVFEQSKREGGETMAAAW